MYAEQRSNSGEQGSMNRALLIALAGLLITTGCSQADPPADHQERREGIERAQKEANKPQSSTELAKYHVTKKKTCQIASQPTTCYSVFTNATSGEDFTAFTQHFRKQSGGVDNVVVTFFFDEPQANSSGMGFAFKSKEAARNILSRSLPQERFQYADLNEEVSKAMQNDGIYVISIEDEIEQRACEDWDSTIIGLPPKQWDCPGY
jgi:hypothetical protein